MLSSRIGRNESIQHETTYNSSFVRDNHCQNLINYLPKLSCKLYCSIWDFCSFQCLLGLLSSSPSLLPPFRIRTQHWFAFQNRHDSGVVLIASITSLRNCSLPLVETHRGKPDIGLRGKNPKIMANCLSNLKYSLVMFHDKVPFFSFQFPFLWRFLGLCPSSKRTLLTMSVGI